jgi:hypothetical protein
VVASPRSHRAYQQRDCNRPHRARGGAKYSIRLEFRGFGLVRNIFPRNPEEAFKILPNLMEFQQVMRNNNPEMSAEQSQKLAYETIRAADLTGQMTDVGAFTHKRSYSSR